MLWEKEYMMHINNQKKSISRDLQSWHKMLSLPLSLVFITLLSLVIGLAKGRREMMDCEHMYLARSETENFTSLLAILGLFALIPDD